MEVISRFQERLFLSVHMEKLREWLSLPDQSVNFLLNELLHMEQIGITLTENGAMRPHATVCGLMLAHPAARYFAVGKIGNDQLEDYARRRRMPINEVRKFLAANL